MPLAIVSQKSAKYFTR